MAATIFEVLNEKIEEYVQSGTEALIRSNCNDFAEYRYVCGQIRGLRVAQTQITDLQRQLMDDDDDE